MKLAIVILGISVCSCASQPAPAPLETFRPTVLESIEYSNGSYAIVGDDALAERAS